jgi:hypothetical protein
MQAAEARPRHASSRAELRGDRDYFREREVRWAVLASIVTAGTLYVVFATITCLCWHTVPGALLALAVTAAAWRSARRWHRLRVAADQVIANQR